MGNAIIRGDGVAASCCAHLLRNARWNVVFERGNRPRLPVILLTDAALELIRDVFEKPDLFCALPRIQQRVVVWEKNQQPLPLEHQGVVVSEETLLENLQPNVPLVRGGDDIEDTWTIYASRPLPAAGDEHSFGSRTAYTVQVNLKDAGACWIESVEDGWLFLIPNAPQSGWLLSVGAPPDLLLARSRIIAEQITGFTGATGKFPSSPRIASQLSGPGWLSCGTAAMAFDPICGDGTAYAIREAILACAVIRAAAAGADVDEVFRHYEARLMAGFQRHLALCRQFYSSGFGGPWWDSAVAALDQGMEWCANRIGSQPEFRYQLRGFELLARN
jgi:hypothetical protein